MTRRKAMTLNEHIDLMKAEGSYNSFVAMRERQEDQRQKHAAEYKRSEVPLMKALHGAGINVDSVWTLVNQSKPYPEALPVLIEELQKSHPPKVINGIARALAVPAARYAWPILVREFKKWPNGAPNELTAKGGLACALAATVTIEKIDELIELVKDPSNGRARVLLLRGLRRSRQPQAKQAIEAVAFDPDLAVEIASWRKRKTKTDH
jgi:hypothetical protein